MTSAQVVETSVTNNSSFQNYPDLDDHTIRTTDTPGFKPFTKFKTLLSESFGGNCARAPRRQSRSHRPRSFWLATGIATSGQVQLRKSAIHGLPVTLRMLRVKSDKSDWLWSQTVVFTKPFKTRMSLDPFSSPEPTILLACGRNRELWPDPIF